MSREQLMAKLGCQLECAVGDFPGIAGISLIDLKDAGVLSINGKEAFPTASSIKIHLLAALHQMQYEGKLNLGDRVEIDRDRLVPGSGVLAYLDDPADLSWRDVANLMIIVSDNTATNMVIDRVGYAQMGEYLEEWGLSHTLLQRKMQEHDKVAQDLENLSTPDDMAKMMQLLWEDRVFGGGVSAEVLRILSKTKRSPIASGLPADVVFAGKPGGMDNVRCDVGIAYLPGRPYILSVMTKFGNLDRTDHEYWIVEVTRDVHHLMSLLAVTSGHGQGIPKEYREF